MEQKKINGKTVAEIGYDSIAKRLEVLFADGKTIRYPCTQEHATKIIGSTDAEGHIRALRANPDHFPPEAAE